jgi:hypothetical protein
LSLTAIKLEVLFFVKRIDGVAVLLEIILVLLGWKALDEKEIVIVENNFGASC